MRNRYGSHTVTRLTVHLVWITKYRYHVHMHIEYPPSKSISDLVKGLKGRSSQLLQKEFPELGKKYWGKHMWGIGYGAWSAGNITDELIQEYLEYHKDRPNEDAENFLLE